MAFPAVTLTLNNKNRQLSHQTDNYLTSLYSKGSEEVPFRRCNNGQPLARLVKQRREEAFYRGEREFGRAVINEKSIGGNWDFET